MDGYHDVGRRTSDRTQSQKSEMSHAVACVAVAGMWRAGQWLWGAGQWRWRAGLLTLVELQDVGLQRRRDDGFRELLQEEAEQADGRGEICLLL